MKSAVRISQYVGKVSPRMSGTHSSVLTFSKYFSQFPSLWLRNWLAPTLVTSASDWNEATEPASGESHSVVSVESHLEWAARERRGRRETEDW